MAGELSCRVCDVGLRIVLAVSAAGAVRRRVGWEAEEGAGAAPGLVGVSAMPWFFSLSRARWSWLSCWCLSVVGICGVLRLRPQGVSPRRKSMMREIKGCVNCLASLVYWGLVDVLVGASTQRYCQCPSCGRASLLKVGR